MAAEVGPDGNLWVADWYNFIIQHNPTPNPVWGGYEAHTGKGNAHINPNRDRDHGRIYRLIWEGAQNRPAMVSLESASPSALVSMLENDNMFWRLTAQRLLVEAQATEIVGLLRKKVLEESVASLHAFWILHALSKLDRQIHQAALLSASSELRRNAIRALGNSREDQQLLLDTAVITAEDLGVRREAYIKMADFDINATLKTTIRRLFREKTNQQDEWLALALKTAAENQGIAPFSKRLGPNIMPNPTVELVEGGEPSAWVPSTYGSRGLTAFSHASGDDQARTGDKALKIQSERGADAGWLATISVKPNTEYRLSGWIKTQGIRGAMGALMNVHGMGQTVTHAIKGDQDWTEVEVTFNTGNRDTIQVNCLFGGWGVSTGTAWFDDLSLQEWIIKIDD